MKTRPEVHGVLNINKQSGKEKATKEELAALQAELERLRKGAPAPLPQAHVISGGGTPMKVAYTPSAAAPAISMRF